MDPISELVRACYAAYENKDRQALENILSEDFTFTSPIDDHISRERYFERCWPNSEHLGRFEIEKLLVDGDEVVVRYQATDDDGSKFRNIENFIIRDGKIHEVTVYFGADTAESVTEGEIGALVNSLAEATRSKDTAALAACYVERPVSFLLAPPLAETGSIIENYAEWFETFEGGIGFDLRDLKIKAGGDSAWCHALAHLTGTKKDGEDTDVWFRITLGCDKTPEGWKIVHIHESVPFLMDGSEKAALGLIP